MTDGGRGIGLLLPFHPERTFLPFRPIPVSPLEASAFLGPRGARILRAEAAALGLPLLGVALAGAALRRAAARRAGPQDPSSSSSTTRRIRSVWEPRQ
jgi:inner membrane protein